MSNYYYMRKAGMCDEEALAFLVVGAIVATPILGLLMIPLNNAVKAREEELAQIRNNMYCELVQVLSEKEIENVLEVTEIENCVFDLIENKLTVLANVDIKEKNEVILAYEYNMSNDLFDLVNQRSIFDKMSNLDIKRYATNHIGDNVTFISPDEFKQIVVEMVNVAKDNEPIIYECSEEQIKFFQKTFYENHENKQNETQSKKR